MTKSDTPVTPDPGTPVSVVVPKVDMKMTPDDFAALRAQATTIGVQDRQLGGMLHSLILHIGHVFGLDPAQEDARIAAKVRQDMRAEEDERLKLEADDRAKARTLEDAQVRTPEQTTALTSTRAAQDAQLKTDADELVRARAEEDAATKGVDHAS
jgi:hypothetical protein